MTYRAYCVLSIQLCKIVPAMQAYHLGYQYTYDLPPLTSHPFLAMACSSVCADHIQTVFSRVLGHTLVQTHVWKHRCYSMLWKPHHVGIILKCSAIQDRLQQWLTTSTSHPKAWTQSQGLIGSCSLMHEFSLGHRSCHIGYPRAAMTWSPAFVVLIITRIHLIIIRSPIA